MRLHLIVSQDGGDVARVNQSCLTADIWLRAECGNTIRYRSNGQPNQLRYAREWLRVAWVTRVAPVYTRHKENTKGERST